MESSVVVAISGGIDSTATVLLLQERGFKVVGLYLDMLVNKDLRQNIIELSARLNIELHIKNVASEFREKLIAHTFSELNLGRTPSPCSRCNHLIKWSNLIQVADQLGIYHIATGHYVQIEQSVLSKGVDPLKDQSYYLWQLTPKILQRAITPLGSYTKAEIRQYLSQQKEMNSIVEQPESMSLCFLQGRGYKEFVIENLNPRAGKVVDQNGAVVGEHSGYQLYTIGQKQGFSGGGVVGKIVPEFNRLITHSDSKELYSKQLLLSNWVLHQEINPHDQRVDIVVRGIGRNPTCGVSTITTTRDGLLEVVLKERDAWAVAAGQPVVFYINNEVMGGGILESAC